MIFGSPKPRQINYKQAFTRLRETGGESYGCSLEGSVREPARPHTRDAAAVAEEVQQGNAVRPAENSAGFGSIQTRTHLPAAGNGSAGSPREKTAPVAAAPSKLEATVAAIADEVRRSLRDEMNSLHLAQNAMVARLVKIEEQVSKSEEACRGLSSDLDRVRTALEDLWRQPDQQQELILACRDWVMEATRNLEERINRHAEAIRSLGAAARGRDKWLEDLHGALKQVGASPGPIPVSLEAL